MKPSFVIYCTHIHLYVFIWQYFLKTEMMVMVVLVHGQHISFVVVKDTLIQLLPHELRNIE